MQFSRNTGCPKERTRNNPTMSIEDILNEWEAYKASHPKKLPTPKKPLTKKQRAKQHRKTMWKPPRNKAEYAAYLASPKWKRTRKKTIKERGLTCEYCGSTRSIEVHHLNYDHIGFEWPEDLLVLCRNCHKTMHEDKGTSSELTDAFMQIVRSS